MMSEKGASPTYIRNPETGRPIRVNGKTHRAVLRRQRKRQRTQDCESKTPATNTVPSKKQRVPETHPVRTWSPVIPDVSDVDMSSCMDVSPPLPPPTAQQEAQVPPVTWDTTTSPPPQSSPQLQPPLSTMKRGDELYDRELTQHEDIMQDDSDDMPSDSRQSALSPCPDMHQDVDECTDAAVIAFLEKHGEELLEVYNDPAQDFLGYLAKLIL